MTPKEVLALCRREEIKAVDLRFMDFPGTQKHFTIPVNTLTEESFEDGFGFDASSMRGWQAINESDMLVVPQPETAMVDPFMKNTLAMTCNIQDPITREAYAKDPRNVARKAEAYMASTGIADVANFGPEAEFFVFDRVWFDQNEHEAYYHVDSAEGQWNRGKPPEEHPGGFQIRHKEGYFPMPPSDTLQDLRTDIMLTLQECGVNIEGQHHEVATGGQCEVDMRYASLLTTADNLLRYKYIVKNVAARHGKAATFMPKPLWNDNGSGLHLHFSLWKNEETLFAGSGYGGLSELALYAMGGILQHAPALLAFCCRRPTATSGSFPASKLRSTLRTAFATGRQRSASPCTTPAPPASGSSSAAPIPRAIRTWPCPQC